MATVPTDLPRRSFIYRTLDQAGAQFVALGDTTVVQHYGDSAGEAAIARRMGLADLSPLPRTGYKGRGAPDWLRAQGLTLPAEPNRAVRQAAGPLVAALSWDEHLILSDLDGDGRFCAKLDGAWSFENAPHCYQLPRRDSHCWFVVCGAHVTEMLAKVCGVDLRLPKFADGDLAQTSLARINGIIIRHDLGTTPAFYIFADSASAEYLWPCLLDAMNEFAGAPVGLAALGALLEDG